jgi:hypothetical protein
MKGVLQAFSTKARQSIPLSPMVILIRVQRSTFVPQDIRYLVRQAQDERKLEIVPSIRGYFRIHTSVQSFYFLFIGFQYTLDREVAFSPAPGARSNVEIEISKWVV